MNKEEKQLRSTKDQLLAELKECDDKLDAIKAERNRKAEIKRTYRPNYVEPVYETNWKAYAADLERHLIYLASQMDEVASKQIDEAIISYKKINSYKVPVDRAKIWNCPQCGESNVLYIGEYGFDEFNREHAVTCSQCDFIGPRISDYGEAWCEFEDWLRKKGYLKDEN